MGIMDRSPWRVFLLVLVGPFFFHHAVSAGRLRLPSENTLGLDDGGNVIHTKRPLIGILSQNQEAVYGEPDSHHPGMSSIVASYVKFVESGGARAVPLLYNEPADSLRRKFNAINGLLFPGGTADLDGGPYIDRAKLLVKWALEANDKGDYFPIYGVCLGLEVLSVVIAGSNVLEYCPATKKRSTINFVDEKKKNEGIFKWIPEDVVEKLPTIPLSVENHSWGLTPDHFASIKALADFFDVLTVTPDDNGDMYVSSLQGKKYPVTAVMFHPEKNVFEWNYDAIPHSIEAIKLSQGIANYVISEARKSTHAPTSPEEENEILINKYHPVFLGGCPGPIPYEEVYYFNM